MRTSLTRISFAAMKCLAFVILLAAGCEKSGPPDLSTPRAAARCQLDAIRARSTEQWGRCWHPLAHEHGVMTELAEHAGRDGFWERAASLSAPLEHAKDSDFIESPVLEKDKRFGDRRAKLRLEHDSFEVVHTGGRWYIVDSGV